MQLTDVVHVLLCVILCYMYVNQLCTFDCAPNVAHWMTFKGNSFSYLIAMLAYLPNEPFFEELCCLIMLIQTAASSPLCHADL